MPSSNTKVMIYVPAYNAEKLLSQTLSRIDDKFRRDPYKLVLVNNASSDRTSQVATESLQSLGFEDFRVIDNAENLGYGGSQKLAYQLAVDEGFRAVLMLHADGQYAPELMQTLLAPVAEAHCDLNFGSRIAGNPLKGGMPMHRYLGNRFLTAFQNIFLGLGVSEYHSGYRVYSTAALKSVPFQRLSTDYHFDTEILILFKHFGLRIGESPIPTHYGEEENFVNIWKYGLDVLVTTFSYFLHKVGLRRSRNWSRILG